MLPARYELLRRGYLRQYRARIQAFGVGKHCLGVRAVGEGELCQTAIRTDDALELGRAVGSGHISQQGSEIPFAVKRFGAKGCKTLLADTTLARDNELRLRVVDLIEKQIHLSQLHTDFTVFGRPAHRVPELDLGAASVVLLEVVLCALDIEIGVARGGFGRDG